ncbi:MAG: DUF7003 family protein [Streptosporangiaceae bacterium]
MGRADEVLAQLDQAAIDFQFPDLSHGYYYAVDARTARSAMLQGGRWSSRLSVTTLGRATSPAGSEHVRVRPTDALAGAG